MSLFPFFYRYLGKMMLRTLYNWVGHIKGSKTRIKPGNRAGEAF